MASSAPENDNWVSEENVEWKNGRVRRDKVLVGNSIAKIPEFRHERRVSVMRLPLVIRAGRPRKVHSTLLFPLLARDTRAV